MKSRDINTIALLLYGVWLVGVFLIGPRGPGWYFWLPVIIPIGIYVGLVLLIRLLRALGK